jgi:hypothetical protein
MGSWSTQGGERIYRQRQDAARAGHLVTEHSMIAFVAAGPARHKISSLVALRNVSGVLKANGYG